MCKKCSDIGSIYQGSKFVKFCDCKMGQRFQEIYNEMMHPWTEGEMPYDMYMWSRNSELFETRIED